MTLARQCLTGRSAAYMYVAYNNVNTLIFVICCMRINYERYLVYSTLISTYEYNTSIKIIIVVGKIIIDYYPYSHSNHY